MKGKILSLFGGIALYVKSTIPTQHLDIEIPHKLECIWMKICPHRLPREVPCIIVAAVYNPPKSRAEKRLLEHIAHTATVFKSKYLNCGFMICSDFNNADISSIHDSELVNVVRQPTRGNNTVDLIISNLRRFYQNTIILPPIGRSDHFTVVWKPSVQRPNPPVKQTHHLQPTTDSATRSFGKWITSYNWKPVLDASTTQKEVDTFYEILHTQINNHFPKNRTKCTTSNKPWITTKNQVFDS